MAQISREEVAHIAALARLELSDEERDALAGDLDRILGYVEALQRLDTSGVEETAHALPLATPLRADVACEPMAPESAVANAPERAGTAFVVPKVIDGNEEG